MPARTFQGFVQTDFQLNSGRDFWHDILTGKVDGPAIGVLPEQAREQLAIHDRFAGRQEMQRVVAITVEPCLYGLSSSKTAASGIAHTARPVEVIDVHELVTDRLSRLERTVVAENVEVKLDDGSVVIGRKIQYGEDPGPLDKKLIVLPELTVTYDAHRFHEDGSFSYSIQFNRSVITGSNPLGFRVTTKVLFDGDPIDTTVRELLPSFSVKNNRIGKFKGFKERTPQNTFHLPVL